MNNQNVIDIGDEENVLKELDYLIQALDSGNHALVLDFCYHLKSTSLGDKIFDIRANISFRLNSSRFHFRLLYSELQKIREKHNNLNYLDSDIRNSPDFQIELDKRHLTYILDSLIFHLTSVFDYTAILINYILSKTNDTPSWNSLENAARGNSKSFKNSKTNEIREIIINIHNNFLRNLYDYRSELIHRNADLIKGTYAWEVMSNKKTLLFLCSNSQKRKFKIEENTDIEISVAYFARHLISETIISLAKIVSSLRKYTEINSINSQLIKEDKLMIAYIDEKTKDLKSPGNVYWNPFDSAFNETHHV